MRWTLRRKTNDLAPIIPPLTLSRPLSESELRVLRDQYEKEGDMASVQTKFNYAWVCLPYDPLSPYTFSRKHPRPLALSHPPQH